MGKVLKFGDQKRLHKILRKVLVDPTTGCWECCEQNPARDGYGHFFDMPAHRAVYMLMVGPISDGLLVRHTCDNRVCVNPAHLLLGTTQDNADDRRIRGRRLWPAVSSPFAGERKARLAHA